MALAGLSAAAAVGITSCGTPAQPDPRPGGAPLSEDVISYDQIDFQTNRDPVLRTNQECAAFDSTTLREVGLPANAEPDQSTVATDGCAISLEGGDIDIMSSPAPFSAYWMGEARQYDAPGQSFDGEGPSSFERKILAEKYHAVEYSTDAGNPNGTCYTAVDTGAQRTLLIGVKQPLSNDVDQPVPMADLQQRYCPVASELAEGILNELDPQGGSRVA